MDTKNVSDIKLYKDGTWVSFGNLTLIKNKNIPHWTGHEMVGLVKNGILYKSDFANRERRKGIALKVYLGPSNQSTSRGTTVYMLTGGCTIPFDLHAEFTVQNRFDEKVYTIRITIPEGDSGGYYISDIPWKGDRSQELIGIKLSRVFDDQTVYRGVPGYVIERLYHNP